MQAERSQTKVLQIQTAVCRPDSGPGGIGVAVPGVGPTVAGHIYEQAYGSREELLYRAVHRALELGKRLGADQVSVLCPDESVVRQINRETPVPQDGRLPLLYMRLKALMYTFRHAEVSAAPEGRVRAAQRLALAASRIPAKAGKKARTLFAFDQAHH